MEGAINALIENPFYKMALMDCQQEVDAIMSKIVSPASEWACLEDREQAIGEARGILRPFEELSEYKARVTEIKKEQDNERN